MASWESKIGHLRAVMFAEGGCWAAQILEYDFATQAETKEAAQADLGRIVVAHIAASLQMGREPFADIGPAPQRFWERYEIGDSMGMSSAAYSIQARELPPIRFDVRIAESLTELV
jgi:hypothetical protein